ASIDTFRRLPADQQIRLAYRAVAHERTGITRHDTAAEAAGRRALDASLGPTSLAGQEARYYRELLQHMNTAKPVPAFVRAMPGLDRLPGGNPSHTRRGSTPLPRPPTPAGDYE